MEDGQWPEPEYCWPYGNPVLILVVMEDGQWLTERSTLLKTSGRLNPWCNGRWSMTRQIPGYPLTRVVLILVVMEDGQWHYDIFSDIEDFLVLILVVMEDGQWRSQRTEKRNKSSSLNPCCNGRWSMTDKQIFPNLYWRIRVLILVVMEDGQWLLIIFATCYYLFSVS